MKKLICKMTLISTILSGTVISQVQMEWYKSYNGVNSSIDIGVDVTVHNNYTIYVLGYLQTSTDPRTKDIITQRYDALGSLLWTHRYNGTGNDLDEPVRILCDNSGNVYVAGNTVSSGQRMEILLNKFRPNGTIEWTRKYPGNGGSTSGVTSMKIDADGNILLTGICSGKIIIIKYSPSGSILWYSLFNDFPGNGNDVEYDNNGNIFVAGFCNRGTQGYDCILLKYSNAGSQIWVRYYGGQSRCICDRNC